MFKTGRDQWNADLAAHKSSNQASVEDCIKLVEMLPRGLVLIYKEHLTI